MSVAIKNAYSGQPGAASTLLYTCPANTSARVIACTVVNDTTTVPTFSINLVPSGGAADDTNILIKDKALGSKEAYTCPEVVGQALDAGDMIYGHPSLATQVTFTLAVVEIV